jgi:Family of unknown function (DUF5662)
MTDAPYDSREATAEHIEAVRRLLYEVIRDLGLRAIRHDESKLKAPEKEGFDRFTPLLGNMEYGSPEYMQALKDMGPTLEHHYAHNDHHPQHFEDGIAGMDLVQLIEMLADWKAATARSPGGDIIASILTNRERFDYGPELERILLNTVKRLGWQADR